MAKSRIRFGGVTLGVALAAGVQVVFAGNPANDVLYSADKGYVWFGGSESASQADSWRSNAHKLWPAVEEGKDPHPNADHDYYVSSSSRRLAMLYVPNTQKEADALPFAGRSLAVACELVNCGAYGTWANFGDNVTMLGGSMFWWNSIGNLTGTRITLGNSSELWPVTFRYAFRSGEASPYEIKFRPAIAGDAESVLVWKHSAAPGTVGMGGKFVIASEWPDFYGTVRFQSHNNTFAPATFTTPGTVVVESNAALLATASSGTSSLATLKVGAGSTVGFATVNNTQTFAVSDKLELEPGAVVQGNKFKSWTSGTPKKYPIFRLSQQAVAAGVPDMDEVACSRLGISNAEGDLPRTRWYVDGTADGGAEIGVTYKEVVTFTNNMSWGKTPFYADGTDANDPVHFLSDGQPLHDGVDYYSASYNLIMRAKTNPYVFPGDSLTLSGPAFGLYGGFTCTNWSLTGGGRFRLMSGVGSRVKLDGNIKTFAASNDSRAWTVNIGDKGTFEIAANLSGNGLVRFGLDPENVSNATTDRRANWCGTDELKGDNSAFVGKMTVTAGAAGDYAKYFDTLGYAPYAPSAVSNVTLKVWSGTALGGPIPEGFAADSLTVDAECRLAVMDTATFAEPTRGWRFPAVAYLFVEDGKTATVRQTLSFGDGATLVKEGAGTLMLGATPAPDAGATKPVLKVAAGGLGFASTTALTGLDVEFAAGTRLVASATPDDPTFAAKGLVLGDTELTLPTSVPVTIDDSGLGKDASATVGLFTVAETEAAALADKLAVKRPHGRRVTTGVVSNGDGTSTVQVAVEPTGFVLLIK